MYPISGIFILSATSLVAGNARTCRRCCPCMAPAFGEKDVRSAARQLLAVSGSYLRHHHNIIHRDIKPSNILLDAWRLWRNAILAHEDFVYDEVARGAF